MSHSVLARPVNLALLLNYFLATIDGDDSVKEYSVPRLELTMKQNDLSIHVLHEGASDSVIPPWYDTANIRRQQGFTPDYFREISIAAETSAHWKTKTGAPVIAHQHQVIFAPMVYFFEVLREPELLQFTLLGYIVTGYESLSRLKPPIKPNNGGEHIFPK
ncbi:hypothetical protein J4444_02875 [Candidatus Woesearchaeota archaeon]|nr:hypothetical protein [Candidatus Woesearchaeota archaeon]